jgi:hypothetical protein
MSNICVSRAESVELAIRPMKKLTKSLFVIKSFGLAINGATIQSRWNVADVIVLQNALLELRSRLCGWSEDVRNKTNQNERSEKSSCSSVASRTIEFIDKTVQALISKDEEMFLKRLTSITKQIDCITKLFGNRK